MSGYGWLVVDKRGEIVDVYDDVEEANRVAEQCDAEWPKRAPHEVRAVEDHE